MGNNKHTNSFWYAVATLVGSTVGVGIFGIPFVFSKAGFLPGILFLVGLTGLVLLLNMMYGEVALRTNERHQLVGYASRYLGPIGKRFTLFSVTLSSYGALLAYIVISGTFLSTIFSGFVFVSPVFFSTLFFIAGGLMIFRGLKVISRYDLVMLGFFILFSLGFIAFGLKHVELSNFTLVNRDFWFLPFGVIFFALNGFVAIPLMHERVDDDHQDRKLKKAILLGTLIPSVIYLIFAVVVVGVTGEITSPDAISGVATFLGSKIAIFGAIFGLCSISTSFMGLGLALRESLEDVNGLSKFTATFWTLIPPYLLYLLGLRNFIEVVGLVGGVALSIDGIVLLFLYAKARRSGDRLPEFSVRLPMPIIYLLAVVFVVAIVFTLIN